jgi:hypothetical protein
MRSLQWSIYIYKKILSFFYEFFLMNFILFQIINILIMFSECFYVTHRFDLNIFYF